MSSEISYDQGCHCCGKVTNVDFYNDYPFCRYLCFDCKVGGGRRSSLLGGVTYFHNNEFVSCCKIPDQTKCNDCYFTCLPYSKKFSNNPFGKVEVFFQKDDIPIDCLITTILQNDIQEIIKYFSGEWMKCSIDGNKYTKDMRDKKMTKVRRIREGITVEVPYHRVRNYYRYF